MKLKKGTDALLEGLEKHEVTDIVDITRADVSKRGHWFGN